MCRGRTGSNARILYVGLFGINITKGKIVLERNDGVISLFYRKQARAGQTVAELLKRHEEGFYLATVHRQENTDDSWRLINIMTALKKIAERVPVVSSPYSQTFN